MSTSKLVRILNTFDKRDWRKFNQYVQSRLRSGSSARMLGNFLIENRSRITDVDLSWTGLQSRLFLNMPRKGLENLIARITKLTIDFLAISSLENDDIEFELLKFKALNERGLFREADGQVKAILNKLDDQHFYNIWKSGFKHRLLHEYYFSDNPVKYEQGADIFSQMTIALDNWQNDLQTYYDIEILNMSQIVGGTWLEIKSDIQSNVLRVERPQSVMLGHLKRMIFDNSDADFFALHTMLMSGEYKISGEMNIVLVIYLSRFASRKAIAGDRLMQQLTFELMAYAVESGIYLSRGRITVQRFLNIVAISNAYGNTDWTSHFVEKFAQFLIETDRQDTVAVSDANILFYQKKYSQVLDALRTINPGNIYIKVEARNLLAMTQFCYYKNDHHLTSVALRNYDEFIRRNRNNMTNRMAQMNHQLGIYLRRLNRSEDPRLILEDLTKHHLVAKRAWLLDYLKQKIGAA